MGTSECPAEGIPSREQEVEDQPRRSLLGIRLYPLYPFVSIPNGNRGRDTPEEATVTRVVSDHEESSRGRKDWQGEVRRKVHGSPDVGQREDRGRV